MITDIAWWLTIACLLALSAVFWFAIAGSNEASDYEPVQKAWYRVRAPWFWILSAIGVAVTVATLSPFPISAQGNASNDAQIVNVKGYQWYWTLDKTELVADQPVEFLVTTDDVTHGFGIYNDELKMLTQTQAIPGYTNTLRYTFTEPGKYKVLCLEYCGVAHHAMLSEFTVIPAAAQ